uniref:Zinc finger CCCH domain-containing protein 10 n=1 Tax=Caenorhabditis tropicalis TaxID=1561998 RepID=A0A1I7UYM9_9PELO
MAEQENGELKPLGDHQEGPTQNNNMSQQQPQQPQQPQPQQQPSSHQPSQEHKQQQRDDVCRDFLKNICNRGSRCKFYHPSEAPPAGDHDYNFCIDYQNRGCQRDNCRFVHAPRDEVERYKNTRELTLILARAIAAVGHGDTIGGIPICKEFQTGRCARGVNRCRYWHVNVDMERDRRARGLPPSNEFGPAGAIAGGSSGGGGGGGGRFPPAMGYGGGGGGGAGRRRPYDDYDNDPIKRGRYAPDDRLMELEKRNAELSKEVDSLRRELQREHDRYEDLYALFRQQSGGAPAPPKATVAPDYYGAWGQKAPGW